jgi:hypothetical protein
MLEKMKAKIKANSELQAQVTGLIILLFLCFLSYSAGRGDGREQAQAELPQLAEVDRKLARIEKAMMKNPVCAAEMLDATRSP